MLILGVFSALTVLTAHTGVCLWVFFFLFDCFYSYSGRGLFGLYANLDFFDSFEGNGFVFGRNLQF